MEVVKIIRAWKEEAYRQQLDEEEQALIPDIPVGELLSETELEQVMGGNVQHPQVLESIILGDCGA